VRLRLIGDVVFTTPLVRAIRREYASARLVYLIEADAAPIVRHNPHLDEVIVAPRTRGLRRIGDDLRLAQQLRRRRFDIVIDLHGGPRSGWLKFASGAPLRIGYTIPGRSWMYTRAVPRARELKPRHSVVNQWDLLESLPGWRCGAPDRERDGVEMPLDAEADARMAARLTRAGIGPTDDLIVVHVSAGNRFRRWPEASFVTLVTDLVRREPNRRVAVSSGPSDREAASRIAATAREQLGDIGSRVVDLGEFDLQELRALIGRSRLFIGGDTGPLHSAAATRTAIVGIYGPTLSAQSEPWRSNQTPAEAVEYSDLPCRPCDQRSCAPGDFRCLTRLAPSAVLEAAERALAAAPRL